MPLRRNVGFVLRPLPDYLELGIVGAATDYGPLVFPKLTAPEDLVLFDRVGSAMKYMLPVSADVNDTFVQILATIGLSVRKGFDWEGLDESTLAGLRRAAPVVDQIIDERWRSMSETVNGWRGSLASGRCSYDWPLNAANTKYQVGTELADQVVYLNTKVDADNQPLNGDNNYVLQFEPGQTPPVAGMWNIAMYDESMLFVANDIDRFSIGSTTDGLTPDADGSLTIYIQRSSAGWRPRCQLAAHTDRELQPHNAVLHAADTGAGQELPIAASPEGGVGSRRVGSPVIAQVPRR